MVGESLRLGGHHLHIGPIYLTGQGHVGGSKNTPSLTLSLSHTHTRFHISLTQLHIFPHTQELELTCCVSSQFPIKHSDPYGSSSSTPYGIDLQRLFVAVVQRL